MLVSKTETFDYVLYTSTSFVCLHFFLGTYRQFNTLSLCWCSFNLSF